jgi:antirestriction protein
MENRMEWPTKTWDEIRGDNFDSRDIIARLEELRAGDEELTEDEFLELDILEDIEKQASQYISDWRYGETFITEDSFEDYAREMADSLGTITGNESWPLNHIDWEAAANELRHDYTNFTFDGVEYLAR